MSLPPIISCCSKIRNGLSLWCWLTQVVLENGCRVVVVCMPSIMIGEYWLRADGAEAAEERMDGRVDAAGSSAARESSDVARGGADPGDDRRRDGETAGLAAGLVGRVLQRQGGHGRGHLARRLSADVSRLQRHLLAVVSDVNCLDHAALV